MEENLIVLTQMEKLLFFLKLNKSFNIREHNMAEEHLSDGCWKWILDEKSIRMNNSMNH